MIYKSYGVALLVPFFVVYITQYTKNDILSDPTVTGVYSIKYFFALSVCALAHLWFVLNWNHIWGSNLQYISKCWHYFSSFVLMHVFTRAHLFAFSFPRLRWTCTRMCVIICSLPWLHMVGPCTWWGSLPVGCAALPAPARKHLNIHTHSEFWSV